MLNDENVSHLELFSTPAYFPFTRSSKYQSSHHKEITDAANTTEMSSDHHSKDSEPTAGLGYEMEANALPAVSKELQMTTGPDESCSKDLMVSEEPEIQEKQEQRDARPSPGDSSVAQQESSFLGNKVNDGSETAGHVAPEPDALEGEGLQKTEEADEKVEEPRQQTESAAVVPPEKVRRFTLDRLKQLGVDVFVKPRLGADEDSFVVLEEPEPNRGNPLNCGGSPQSDLFRRHSIACHFGGQGTQEKPTTTHDLIPQMYRHPVLLCFTYCTSQILHFFLQIEGRSLHQQNDYDFLYCNTCFIVVVWN